MPYGRKPVSKKQYRGKKRGAKNGKLPSKRGSGRGRL